MQRVHVLDTRDGSQVPFLRGILTRSIQKSGVAFDEAYQIADAVRTALADRTHVTTDELRELVYEHLMKSDYVQEATVYHEKAIIEPTLHIIDSDGTVMPFSKGVLSQSMEICGFDQETAYQITKTIELELTAEANGQFTSKHLASLTYKAIEAQAGTKSAGRYQQWRAFTRSGRPLILLIGGTTGSGKSTIGSELAHRLDIVRTQSTDMLREVMRLMIPPRLLPTLHTSSFEAHKQFPTSSATVDGGAIPSMLSGYLSQADQVSVGIEGVLSRAENEQVSVIIEGVHVHPSLQQNVLSSSEAVVVPIILAVLKKKALRKRLKGRGQQVTSRRSERYIDNFDHIWDLQSFLLDEADHFDIPIVENIDEDEAIRNIMQTISTSVASLVPASQED